jgi:hypothetical protein
MSNELINKRWNKFQALADQYGLRAFPTIPHSTETPWAFIDMYELHKATASGNNMPIEAGVGSLVDPSVLGVISPDEAEKKVHQLTYDLLNRAGFSVLWTGSIDSDIIIQCEPRGFGDGEETNE